jgi:hypothetical protein
LDDSNPRPTDYKLARTLAKSMDYGLYYNSAL